MPASRHAAVATRVISSSTECLTTLMSDTTNTPAPAPAVAEPVSASPVDPVAPASTPAIESAAPGASSDPAPVETAPAEPAAPAEAEPTAAEPEVKAHTDTPTLLETIGDEAKPETTDAAPDAGAPSYDFKLPENFEAVPEQIQAYTGILQESGIPPEIGQKLLDLHAAQIERYAADTLTRQHQVFADTRKGWQEQIKGDPELGGAGFETVAKAVARARDALVPADHQAEFNDMLRVTGVGDHPAFWRMLRQASRFLDEPPPPPPNARPSPSANPAQKAGFKALFDYTPNR